MVVPKGSQKPHACIRSLVIVSYKWRETEASGSLGAGEAEMEAPIEAHVAAEETSLDDVTSVHTRTMIAV